MAVAGGARAEAEAVAVGAHLPLGGAGGGRVAGVGAAAGTAGAGLVGAPPADRSAGRGRLPPGEGPLAAVGDRHSLTAWLPGLPGRHSVTPSYSKVGPQWFL